MRFSHDKLSSFLSSNPLPNLIVIDGNEVLLVEEVLDVLRQRLKENGATERLTYAVDASFDWGIVGQAEQTMSMFAESRLLELRSLTGKFGTKGNAFLADLAKRIGDPQSDELDVFIVIVPLFSAQQRKSKWVSTAEKAGWVIDCYDVKPEQFPQWIKHRLQSRALRVEAGVVDMLSYTMEGNLLAASQAIEQLKGLSTDGGVTLSLLEKTIEDQSRFTVYSVVDSCLLGDASEVLHRLERLRGESDLSVLLVWALAKQVRELLGMVSEMQKGSSINDVMRSYRVWQNRQRMVSSALNRLSSDKLQQALQTISSLDAMSKGQLRGDVWFEIEKLCLHLCSVDKIAAIQAKPVNA